MTAAAANPMAAVTTVDAEKFKSTVFLRMVTRHPGTRAKIRNLDSLKAYFAALEAEKRALAERTGKPVDTSNVALDGAASASDTVKATKRLFIPIPPTKENNVQVVQDPIERAIRFIGSVKARLVGRFGSAQPSRIMDGLFVLPEGKVGAYNEEIGAAKAKLNLEFLPEIEAAYDEAIEKARTAPLLQGGLGPLFDSRDYPTAEQFTGQFDIDCLWLKLGVPDNLPKELQEQFRADFERRTAAANEEIWTALRVQFQKLIDHAAEILTPAEDGKPRRFQASTLDNIKSFIQVFQDRNIFNDADLQALVEKSRAIMTGIDAEQVRKSGEVRDNLKAKFDGIKAELDKLVCVTPTRQLDLDDD